jgi:uncharacterized protein YuzB (UPF0349 family)
MTPHSLDTVGALIQGSDEIVQPEELLFLAQHADFDVVEYGESVAELVVRRMIMMAKMTFMAAYRYYTYSYWEDGEIRYIVADYDMGPQCEGYYTCGDSLETVVDNAYGFLQEAMYG